MTANQTMRTAVSCLLNADFPGLFQLRGGRWNRPFAQSGHKVQNHICWWASCAVGLPKQCNLYQSTWTCLCFGSPTAQLAHRQMWFCTMWPDCAKALSREAQVPVGPTDPHWGSMLVFMLIKRLVGVLLLSLNKMLVNSTSQHLGSYLAIAGSRVHTLGSPLPLSTILYSTTKKGPSRCMVSALVSRSSSLGSNPGQEHWVVFFGKTLDSHITSLHPGV